MLEFFVLNVLTICFLGFATSFTDLKKGLIQNKFVFPAIAFAFALNFLNGLSFVPFLINGFLAFLLGFLLWLASLWSAGDAKLFLAFALLFPISLYGSSSAFPAFSILVNSFVPAFALLLFLVLKRTTRGDKIKALKKSFEPRLVLSVAIFFFAFYWLIDLLLSFLEVQLDFFTAAILLFLVIAGVEFLLPKKSLYFFGVVSLAFLLFRLDSVLSFDFLFFFLSFLLMALILLFFVLRLGIAGFGKPVAINDLKPGMALLETVVEKNGTVEKKEPLLPSFVNIFFEIREKPFLKSGSSGLVKEDIAMLKKAKAQRKVRFERLLVQETLPFAPLIFIGTLLSFFTPLFFYF